MSRSSGHRGFSILELMISLAVVAVLLAVLVPTLSAARKASHRDQCADHLRRLGEAWATYLEDHHGDFPVVPVQAAWYWGGVRHSAVDDHAFLDSQRPLRPYIENAGGPGVVCCPADHGITGETSGVGTAGRTACRAYGTSYRANAELVGGRTAPAAPTLLAVNVHAIGTARSRLLLMGDPFWFEVYEQTGRDASWHGEANVGNLLFLDGSVKFMTIKPKSQVGPVVIEPKFGGGIDPK